MPEGYVRPVATAEGRAEIASRWRKRADGLEDYARGLRAEGDTLTAFDAEMAAVDYREAADALEGGASDA